MFAPYKLPSQIKVMIVAGMVIVSVGKENSSDENGFIPLTNMWWPHTSQLRKPMDIIEYRRTLALSIGLRILVTRTCVTIPMAGRMAMYTSGCPKNQNMCCQSSGEPPACGWSLSPTTSPAGMKKLVPAFLSRISSKQAGRSTAKAINPMHEVINHAQVDDGM